MRTSTWLFLVILVGFTSPPRLTSQVCNKIDSSERRTLPPPSLPRRYLLALSVHYSLFPPNLAFRFNSHEQPTNVTHYDHVIKMDSLQ